MQTLPARIMLTETRLLNNYNSSFFSDAVRTIRWKKTKY